MLSHTVTLYVTTMECALELACWVRSVCVKTTRQGNCIYRLKWQQTSMVYDGSSSNKGKSGKKENIDGDLVTTTSLETFAKEKNRDGAGEQRV